MVAHPKKRMDTVLIPDSFLFQKTFRGREDQAMAQLIEYLGRFCNYRIITDSTQDRMKKEWLSSDVTFDTVAKVKKGDYKDLVLYKDNRTVMEIRGRQWPSLKLCLTREEHLGFREFLASAGLPRNLFVAEGEASGAFALQKK